MAVKFIELDFKQPVEPLHLEDEVKRLLILVFWGERPCGFARFKVNKVSRRELLDPEALRNKIAWSVGWELWKQAISGSFETLNQGSLPAISVVVCTRDRRYSLESCLESLKKQNYPHYEVVVVDNGSRDLAVAEVIHQSGFRYVREDRTGLDWARNRGLQEASHAIIAFIDDDAIASPDWLQGIARGFSDPEIMLVTGLVVPGELQTSAQLNFEIYGGMGKGFYRFTIRPELLSLPDLFWASSWGVGTNMAIRRSLVEKIGGFDVALDVGTPAGGGGDIEYFYRTASAGFALRYEPSAWIRHYHRRESGDLIRQIRANGRSFPNYLLTIGRNEPHKRKAVLKFALYHWLWQWLLRRLIGGVIRRDWQTAHLALTELRGSLSALPAYWQSQRKAARLKEGSLSHGKQEAT